MRNNYHFDSINYFIALTMQENFSEEITIHVEDRVISLWLATSRGRSQVRMWPEVSLMAAKDP